MGRVINVDKALKHAMNDRSLLVDLLRFTLEDVPEMLRRLDEVIREGADPSVVAEWAHKIKGSAGAVSAEKLFSAAFDLEEAAKEKRRESFDDLYLLLKESFSEFSEDGDVNSFL